MIWPIVGGVALGGTALACGLGIPVMAGTVGNVQWRVSWACWRWKAQTRVPGGKWELAGYGGGWGGAGHEAAMEIAKSRASALAVQTTAFQAGSSQKMILIGKRVS